MRLVFFFLWVCLFAMTVKCDLPIHCLNTHIAGTWKFSVSDLTTKPTDCGYSHPDSNRYHFDHPAEDKFSPTDKIDVTLRLPDYAESSSSSVNGSWTMVYDEGFEVTLGDRVYFAFSKYVPRFSFVKSDEVADYRSICTETMVGWFRTASGMTGCWKGERTDSASLIAANTIKTAKDSEHIVTVIPDIPVNLKFKADEWLIHTVNNDPASSWTAVANSRFQDQPLADVMVLLGAANYAKQNVHIAAVDDLRADTEKYSGLPDHWDWREHGYVDEVVDQGNCGSCYAMATISAVNSRFRVKSEGKMGLNLSGQNLLTCSSYNQGCEGGYPYLAAKYGADYGFSLDTCDPYKDGKIPEKSCSNKQCNTKFYLSDYYYIGGYYGNCSEVSMMHEVMESGPIVSGFQAPYSLFSYESGIFTGPDAKKEGAWEQTNHAVVIVGWGVDTARTPPMKYWIVKNTWGKDWGEDGYFRIRRGRDECGIESMSVAPVVEWEVDAETL